MSEVQVNHYIDAVNRIMLDSVRGRLPVSLYSPMGYLLESGGKRIRPLLLILSCGLIREPDEAAIRAAAAVELLHNYTLIHDDIMDHDDLRRGRLTVHRKWDEPTAILAGDGMMTLAFQTLQSAETSELPGLIRIFTNGLLTICEGQAMDKEFETESEITLAQYNKMITFKTARLLEVACEMGLIIGGGDQTQRDAIRDFACSLGIAFQIRDDLLDIVQDETASGKTFGSDIIEKKKTYLSIDFLQCAPGPEKEKLLKVWVKETIGRDDLLMVKRLFSSSGILENAQETVINYIEKALKCLGSFRESGYRTALSGIAESIGKKIV